MGRTLRFHLKASQFDHDASDIRAYACDPPFLPQKSLKRGHGRYKVFAL
jgi:hypothetical protein